jgi:hypothetical protein
MTIRKPLPKLHCETFVEMNKDLMGAVEIFSNMVKKEQEKLSKTPSYLETVLDDEFFDRCIEVAYGEDTVKKHPDEFATITSTLFHVYYFMLEKKIYKLEKVLIDRLLHTSLKKVDSCFINSPYRSIYVSIPNNGELLVPNEETGLHRAIGFYIWFTNLNEGDEIKMIDNSEPTNVMPKASGKKLLRACFIGEPKKGADPLDDAVYYISLPLESGDVFDQYKKKLFGLEYFGEELKYVDKLFAFMLNTLLYLTSEDRMITHYASIYKNRKRTKSTKKQAKIDRRLEKYSKFSYYNVGEGLHEVLVSRNKPNYSSTDDRTHRRTPIPHTVGGHWLTYWKGHGDNKKPVKKWRASFSRGSYKL